MSFDIALGNVLVTLFYILPGFIICKMKRAFTDHLSTLSGVLVYVSGPCMVISAFLSLDFSMEMLANMGLFFVITLILQCAFMGMVYLIIRKKSADPKYRLMTIGMVLGNVGFFGLPIVRALLPENPEVASYSIVYIVSMNILVFTVGVFCLTGNKKYMSIRPAILNPTIFGFSIGFPLFLLGAKVFLPELLTTSVSLLGNMSTPLCMLILGIRLATVSLPKLFARPSIYIICLGKLLLFPLFAFFAVKWLPLPEAFKASILILSATPCASVIFNLSEMHRVDAELAANCILLSTLMCFLTIPTLTLLV
jgi:predicted permease